MSKTSQKIHLDKEGDVFDGIHRELTENDANLTARFRIIEDVEIVVPVDSPEGKILKEKLTDDLRGKRILVYKTDTPSTPLIVAEKRANHSNNTEN